jgi:hypothetical protein
MDKNRGHPIAVAGNQTSVPDVVRALIEAGYRVAYLLNVGPDKAHMIADYHDLTGVARAFDIELIRPPTFAMKDEASRALFESKRIDLLVSVGWQRLIPARLRERVGFDDAVRAELNLFQLVIGAESRSVMFTPS